MGRLLSFIQPVLFPSIAAVFLDVRAFLNMVGRLIQITGNIVKQCARLYMGHGVDIVKDREINTKVVMVTSSTLECVITCSHLVVTTSANKRSRSITLQSTTSAW